MLTLDTKLHSELIRLSKAVGIPATRFVYEILSESLPQIIRIREAAELAASRSDEKKIPSALMSILDSHSDKITEFRNNTVLPLVEGEAAKAEGSGSGLERPPLEPKTDGEGPLKRPL